MPERRRWGCWIALAVVVAVAVAVAAWWAWYVRTPEYSVRMVAESVDQGDWQAFSAYVDVDRLVASAVESEIESRFPKDETNPLVRKLVDASKPQLESAATSALRTAIEARAGRRRQLPSIAYALGPADIRRLPSSSATDARFDVTLPLRGQRVTVRVRLVPAGDRWRVVGVENVGQLLRDLGVRLPQVR